MSERERFEAWVRTQFANEPNLTMYRPTYAEEDAYHSGFVQRMWEGWRAGRLDKVVHPHSTDDGFNAAVNLRDLVRRLRAIAHRYRAGTEEALVLSVAADVILASVEDYNDARKVTDEMVNRFLAWRLPESVCVDLCCIKYGEKDRIGTQLLTADEARAMLEYVLAKTPHRERDGQHG